MINRRIFLKSVTVSTGAAFTSQDIFSKQVFVSQAKIACQQYTWSTYFKRENKSWMDDPEKSLKAFHASGLSGYEPIFNSHEEVLAFKATLHDHKIWSKSMYVNSVLHDPSLVEKNIEDILAIAQEAKNLGIEILVTNPTPIKWGGAENKSDEQLKSQAIAMNTLGEKLKAMDIKLAYHNHDAEMRESAREFHHMLTGTDPANVHLCLDAHWIYRGSGNSEVALFDIIELYADRIVELHLRQSQNGIWSEVFADGDIDYSRLAAVLKKKDINPHLVLEQAVETGTPQTMSTVKALSESLINAKKVFANFS